MLPDITPAREYLKKFYLDLINHATRNNSISYLASGKIDEYFNLHSAELEINLTSFNLTQENGLINFIFTVSEIDKYLYDSEFKAIIIKIILLLGKLNYTLNDEDVHAIENANIYKFHGDNEKDLQTTAEILKLYHISHLRTGKYFLLDGNIGINIFEEDYTDKLLSKYIGIVAPEVLMFYKECYLKTRAKKQLSLLFQMNNKHVGWHARPIRGTLQLLIPLCLTVNTIHLEELYKYIREEGLQELLNTFSKNLLSNLEKNIDQFREIVLNNQPLPITVRCHKHAVGVLIYNGYFVYFNTGEATSRLDSGAMYYKIVNVEALLNHIVTEKDSNGALVKKDFLHKLSEFFKKVEELEKFVADLVVLGLLTRIHLQTISLQTTGDCSMRALSYLVPAMLTIKLQEQQSSDLDWISKAKSRVVKHTLVPVLKFVINRYTKNEKDSNFMQQLSNLDNPDRIKFKKAAQIAYAAWEKMYEYAKNIFLENTLTHGVLEPEFISELLKQVKEKTLTDKSTIQAIKIIEQSVMHLQNKGKSTSTCSYIDSMRKSTMQFWKKVEATKRLFAEEFGLNVVPIPGDGHCLFNAVALYLNNTNVQDLRNKVANTIERNPENYREIIAALNPNRTLEVHIRAIRDHEWADNLEIAVLMRVLDRPIYVVDNDGNIRNNGAGVTGAGEPIFVYYNGHNHYDGLVIAQQGVTGREVLERLERRIPVIPQPQLFTDTARKVRIARRMNFAHRGTRDVSKKRTIDQTDNHEIGTALKYCHRAW